MARGNQGLNQPRFGTLEAMSSQLPGQDLCFLWSLLQAPFFGTDFGLDPQLSLDLAFKVLLATPELPWPDGQRQKLNLRDFYANRFPSSPANKGWRRWKLESNAMRTPSTYLFTHIFYTRRDTNMYIYAHIQTNLWRDFLIYLATPFAVVSAAYKFNNFCMPSKCLLFNLAIPQLCIYMHVCMCIHTHANTHIYACSLYIFFKNCSPCPESSLQCGSPYN